MTHGMGAGMGVALIRHGATPGNALHRYVGAGTDEPLAPGVFERLRDAAPALERSLASRPRTVVTSGMLRCRQTAAALFPKAAQAEDPELREMRFGRFENRSASEMEHDAAYRFWVEGGCRGPVPGGEDPAAFRDRCCAAFEAHARRAQAQGRGLLVLVVHGGTIRAIIERMGRPPCSFFEIPVPSACCWLGAWSPAPPGGGKSVLRDLSLLEFPYDGFSHAHPAPAAGSCNPSAFPSVIESEASRA